MGGEEKQFTVHDLNRGLRCLEFADAPSIGNRVGEKGETDRERELGESWERGNRTMTRSGTSKQDLPDDLACLS